MNFARKRNDTCMHDFRYEPYSKPKSFRLLSPDENKPGRIYSMSLIEHAKKKYMSGINQAMKLLFTSTLI